MLVGIASHAMGVTKGLDGVGLAGGVIVEAAAAVTLDVCRTTKKDR